MIDNYELKKVLGKNNDTQKLSVGIPTIESYNKLLKSQVFLEIEKFSKKILSNYDAYRNNAFRCYQERYELSKHFRNVIEKCISSINRDKVDGAT